MKIQQSLVLVVLLLCTGMSMAETFEQSMNKLLDVIENMQYREGKRFEEIKSLEYFRSQVYIFMVAALIASVIFLAWQFNHGGTLDQHETKLRKIADLITRAETLEHQNKDLINRHEELIKLLLGKMGTQAPTQTVVLQQQPKPISKPTREIIEFNPNSSADQTWLADQKRKRQPNR